GRHPPGTGERTWDCDWASLCRAEGEVLAPGIEGAETGDGALRDGAGTSDADRLRRYSRLDRRRAGADPCVCRDAWLFAPDACPGLAEAAPSGLVRRDGGRVPAVWRRSRGSADRQCEGAGRTP